MRMNGLDPLLDNFFGIRCCLFLYPFITHAPWKYRDILNESMSQDDGESMTGSNYSAKDLMAFNCWYFFRNIFA